MILFKVLRAMRWHTCIGFMDILQHGVEGVVHYLLMLGKHIENFSIHVLLGQSWSTPVWKEPNIVHSSCRLFNWRGSLDKCLSLWNKHAGLLQRRPWQPNRSRLITGQGICNKAARNSSNSSIKTQQLNKLVVEM